MEAAALVLFLTASCSISAVTVCEWRGKPESELVSLQEFTSASLEKNLCCTQPKSAGEEDARGTSRDGKRDGLVWWEVPQQHPQGTVIDVHCVPQQWELHQVFILSDQKQQTAASGNTVIQVHNALCLALSLLLPLTLPDPHIFSPVLTLFL